MSVRHGSPRPEDFARALLARFDLRWAEDLDGLASKIGLRIREVNAEGFEGALLRVPGKARGIIAIRSDVRDLGRRRFTIAHEMGHYIIPRHGMYGSICTDTAVDLEGGDSLGQEEAANRFASELLLPSAFVRPIVHERSPTIATAKWLSESFRISLTAAVAKCVEVAHEPCALVVSVAGNVTKCKPNAAFNNKISAGRILGFDTKARYLSEEAGEGTNGGLVPASAWLDAGSWSGEMTIREDSILLPQYEKVLTILTVARGS